VVFTIFLVLFFRAQIGIDIASASLFLCRCSKRISPVPEDVISTFSCSTAQPFFGSIASSPVPAPCFLPTFLVHSWYFDSLRSVPSTVIESSKICGLMVAFLRSACFRSFSLGVLEKFRIVFHLYTDRPFRNCPLAGRTAPFNAVLFQRNSP